MNVFTKSVFTGFSEVFKPLIFYSDDLRQVVACGSKSVIGRNFNADMASEISWKLIVIKKKLVTKTYLSIPSWRPPNIANCLIAIYK